MASEKVLELKKQQVAEVTDLFKNSVAGVVVDYKGINVEQDTKLRKELRESGVRYIVLKNTILRLAADNADLSGLKDSFTGTTAVAFSSEDHTAAARILDKCASQVPTFSIKSGFLEGDVIDLATVQSLAKLPTRDVLLATVCSALNAPIAALARGIQAIVDKGGVEACEPAEKEEAEEAAPAEEAAEAPAEEAAEAPAEESAE